MGSILNPSLPFNSHKPAIKFTVYIPAESALFVRTAGVQVPAVIGVITALRFLKTPPGLPRFRLPLTNVFVTLQSE